MPSNYEQGGLDYDQMARDLMAQVMGQGATGNNANNYVNRMLGGDTNTNPFMGRLNGSTQQWGGQVDSGYQNLMSFLNGALTGGGGRGGAGGGGGGGGVSVIRSNPANAITPDTVGNRDTFFANNAKFWMDPSRLDPANDPTIEPMLAALRKEGDRNLGMALQDVAATAERSGRMGSGAWRAVDRGTRDAALDSQNQAAAGAMVDSRKAAMALQQAIMGEVNDRDMNELNQGVNMANAEMAANASAAANRVDPWTQKMQAASLLLDATKLGLGTQTDLAGLFQTGQGNALQAALGLGNLDLNRALGASNIGQGLGLGGLNFGFGVQQAEAAGRRADEQNAWEREYSGRQEERQSLMDILNMIGMFGDLGGTDTTQTTSGGDYYPGGTGGAGDLMGLLGGFLQGWGGSREAFQ